MSHGTSTVTAPAADKVKCAPHAHSHGDGLMATVEGMTLDVVAIPNAGVTGPLSITITGADGQKISDFAAAHTKKMHLIAVREDLGAYQHLHPEVDADGVWTVEANFTGGGKWRIITDVVSMEENEDVILGKVIDVDGPVEKFTLPAAGSVAPQDGFEFKVSGGIASEGHGELMINGTKDGKTSQLESYLGANAHLVAIRTDGTYAHFHPHSMSSMNACGEGSMPVNDPGAAADAAMGMMHFMTEVPGAGTYRLFLQFQVDGTLHTVPFTADVA